MLSISISFELLVKSVVILNLGLHMFDITKIPSNSDCSWELELSIINYSLISALLEHVEVLRLISKFREGFGVSEGKTLG